MKPKPGLLVVLLALVATGPADAECDRIPRCQLVWADEFEGATVDTDKWEFMTGTGTAYGLTAGWGNNELQSYQEQNATVAGGFLTITARREAVAGSSYTSARLRTLGRAEWTYGRMEMRARMPSGRGLWPAFWMLPSDPRYGSWAASGEIDIMEYLGHQPARIHGTIHYGSPWPDNAFTASTYDLASGGFDEDFHVFAVEWERGLLRWYADGVLYAIQTEWFSSAARYPAPFDVDFHLLVNLAVGGNFPGSPDDSTSFPQELVVDYVRVYQTAPIKGAHSGAISLTYERPVRMKKIEGRLALPFQNQARKRDKPDHARRVSCTVSAFGARGPLAARGEIRLVLEGSRAGVRWTSAAIEAGLDRRGAASFGAAAIAAQVEEAATEGASLDRLILTLSGAGGQKTRWVDLGCWQEAGAG